MAVPQGENLERQAKPGHDVVVLVPTAELEIVVNKRINPFVELHLHPRADQAAAAACVDAVEGRGSVGTDVCYPYVFELSKGELHSVDPCNGCSYFRFWAAIKKSVVLCRCQHFSLHIGVGKCAHFGKEA